MASRIVVNTKTTEAKKAEHFVCGTVLRCVSAPRGYLYAIGQIALKPKYYRFDDSDFVIQHNVDDELRIYPSTHIFYKEATFVEAEKGTTITIEAL